MYTTKLSLYNYTILLLFPVENYVVQLAIPNAPSSKKSCENYVCSPYLDGFGRSLRFKHLPISANIMCSCHACIPPQNIMYS